jgi:TPR repeat protein
VKSNFLAISQMTGKDEGGWAWLKLDPRHARVTTRGYFPVRRTLLKARLVIIAWLVSSMAAPGKIDVEALTKRAKSGDPSASVILGEAYYRGTGVGKDFGKAREWFEAAANESVEAKAWLGICLLEGSGIQKDEEKGTAMVREAAEAGNAVAQRLYASCFKWTDGMEGGKGVAVRWLEKAAAQGDPRAQTYLARSYEMGCGVEADPKAASRWYEAAAAQGEPQARAWIGRNYLLGCGVARDQAKAIEIFQKLADEEEALGYRQMATAYLDGWGVPKNAEKGAALFLKAAEMGDYVAQRGIAECYLQGEGVKQDFSEALKWTRKFTEDRPYTAGALADFFYDGTGVERDRAEAARLYRLAAKAGDPVAQFRLAGMLEEGDGVECDPVEARHWISRAAKCGNVEAAARMARALTFGTGMAEDKSEGLAWALVVGDAFTRSGSTSESIRKAFQQVRHIIEAAPRERMDAATIRARELLANRLSERMKQNQ